MPSLSSSFIDVFQPDVVSRAALFSISIGKTTPRFFMVAGGPKLVFHEFNSKLLTRCQTHEIELNIHIVLSRRNNPYVKSQTNSEAARDVGSTSGHDYRYVELWRVAAVRN